MNILMIHWLGKGENMNIFMNIVVLLVFFYIGYVFVGYHFRINRLKRCILVLEEKIDWHEIRLKNIDDILKKQYDLHCALSERVYILSK